jgi:predicted acetyltransferase
MRLVEPSLELKDAYLTMISEWAKVEDLQKTSPFPLGYDISDFDSFLNILNNDKVSPREGFVPSTTFCLVNEEHTIVGLVNLRHYLNERLSIMGGHIGYGVPPSERKKGYATKMLELTLIEAKKLGIENAFVTCYTENIGSNKTIVNNGGILAETSEVDGRMTNKYWININ